MSDKITDHKQLTTVYKKNGSFDKQRKLLLENFKESETYSNLLLKLRLMVENKIKNDPSVLMKNKGKMAALIQGEIINQHLSSSKDSRSNKSLLSIVDKDIQEKIIDSPEFHESLKEELKDINRQLLGISDEDYAKQQEQEKLEREQELQKIEEKKQEEKELAYNSYKAKHLNQAHKITKPPRFNFGSTSQSIRDKDRDSRNLGEKKGIPHLMY